MRSALPLVRVAAASLLLSCQAALAAGVLIFGEMHDQPDQQRQVAEEVQRLASAGRLAALVLEMAEAPHSSAALPREATAEQVQAALQWRGWPWPAYAEIVMNAVRAGVPVLGGNLPRAQLREAMLDAQLDARVDAAVRERIGNAVRTGHCELLPAEQLPGMVRIQIARDRAMAEVVSAAARDAPPGSTVLLLTGAQHASRDRGVPLHLAPGTAVRVVLFSGGDGGLAADESRSAAFAPQRDHCADLRQQLAAPAAASAPR